MKRSEKRQEFLNDLLVTAIENFGYGSFVVNEYDPYKGEGSYAEIGWYDDEYDPTKSRVDYDLLVKGLRIIRKAELQPVDEDGNEVLFSAGKRLYLSPGQRKNIMLADRTNGDEGDIDVVDALAVLEIGVFGQVVFA